MKNKFLTILIILIGLTFISCEVEPIDVIEPETLEKTKEDPLKAGCYPTLADGSSLAINRDWTRPDSYKVEHFAADGTSISVNYVSRPIAVMLCRGGYKTMQDLYDDLYVSDTNRTVIVYCSYTYPSGEECYVYLQGGAAWIECSYPDGTVDDDGTGNIPDTMTVYDAYEICKKYL